MTIVYTTSHGEYSEYEIARLFKDRAKAQEFCDYMNECSERYVENRKDVRCCMRGYKKMKCPCEYMEKVTYGKYFIEEFEVEE